MFLQVFGLLYHFHLTNIKVQFETNISIKKCYSHSTGTDAMSSWINSWEILKDFMKYSWENYLKSVLTMIPLIFITWNYNVIQNYDSVFCTLIASSFNSRISELINDFSWCAIHNVRKSHFMETIPDFWGKMYDIIKNEW